ncbi:MAG: glycosyltransferase [bacterium]|nr:glycosyltransferase [bacterium]
MAEILNGELSTFLIPAGRDELFVERLLSVCTNRAALRTVRQAFRERATNEYSFERSMQRYWRILLETTERS